MHGINISVLKKSLIAVITMYMYFEINNIQLDKYYKKSLSDSKSGLENENGSTEILTTKKCDDR